MARFAILVREIKTGDGVGNDVLGEYGALAAQGHQVRLFAESWQVAEPKVRPIQELAAFLRPPSTFLLYHHATGWPRGLPLFQKARCRKILRYHNITPPHFFEDIDPISREVCRLGREQLRLLVEGGCDLFMAPSDYNRQELLALGAREAASRVVPSFHQIDQLQALPADPTVLEVCRDGQTNILFVGRVVPNKGHLALLEAFAVYQRWYNPRSRLLLVGREYPAMGIYNGQLRAQIRALGLERAVAILGETGEEALKAYYQVADVFLSTSAHEGFCVPLVEAMAQRVPVVAYGSSAVPETVGPAGLVWESPDPFLLAASVHRLMADSGVRTALTEQGWKRYQERFSTPQVEAAFLGALESFLQESGVRSQGSGASVR